MGWKASCIMASIREPGFLGTFPEHDPVRADAIIKQLGLGNFRREGPTSFEDGVYPQDDGIYLGAYDGAIILGTSAVAEQCLTRQTPAFVQNLSKCLPNATMLAMVLHSVVNLFGYAVYQNGELIRVRAGSADDGLIIEYGDPLPEEETLFAKSVLKDGERIYRTEINGQLEEFTEDAFGEEFVFDLSQRFLGTRFDQFDPWDLKMEKFTPIKSRSIWSWFKKS